MIQAVKRALVSSPWAARASLGVVGAFCVVMAAFSCGGTTGKEGLPMPVADDASATVDASADVATDGTVGADTGDLDAGTFDVPIIYADRELPDVVAKEGGAGGDGGHPWPDCPPFVPVDSNRRPTQLSQCVDEVPGMYFDAGADAGIVYDDSGTVSNVILDDAGRVVLYSDASACGSIGWFGSTATDECLTSTFDLTTIIDFPPCNWCAGFGNATAGPRAGDPLYDICMDLYECAENTGCGRTPGTCLCGDSGTQNCTPTGPCAQEVLAGFQSRSDPASIVMVTNNYNSFSSTTDPWYCAGALNQMYNSTFGNMCFVAADAGGD